MVLAMNLSWQFTKLMKIIELAILKFFPELKQRCMSMKNRKQKKKQHLYLYFSYQAPATSVAFSQLDHVYIFNKVFPISRTKLTFWYFYMMALKRNS